MTGALLDIDYDLVFYLLPDIQSSRSQLFFLYTHKNKKYDVNYIKEKLMNRWGCLLFFGFYWCHITLTAAVVGSQYFGSGGVLKLLVDIHTSL